MPGVIRAKFKCNSVTKRTGWNGSEFVYDAKFSPVTSGSDENKKFYAATPGGECNLISILPDAFVVGSEYYLDFTPA